MVSASASILAGIDAPMILKMSIDQQRNAPAVTGSPALPAVVVCESNGEPDQEESRYAMFSASELTENGAFLHGSLLLELGETVTLELSVGAGKVRASARVVALETGQTPGMKVEFASLPDRDRRLIQEQTDRSSQA